MAIRVVGTDPGAHDHRLRSDHLRVMSPTRTTMRGVGATMVMEWRASRLDVNAPWTVVATRDSRTTQRREIFVR